MRTRLKLAVVGFMAAGFIACGSDEGTGPGDQGFGKDEGEIRFSYSGAKMKGEFRARGAFQLDARGNPKPQSFAYGVQQKGADAGVPFDLTNIIGFDIHLPKIDMASGVWTSLKTGKFSAAEECLDQEWMGSASLNCAGFLFMLGIDLMQWGEEDVSAPQYYLTAGTVEVTSISNGRVRGTFQGTASLLDEDPDSLDVYVPGADLAVTNGTFNVPLRNDIDLGLGLNRVSEPRALHSWWLPVGSLLSR